MKHKLGTISQQRIVFALSVALFAAFSLLIPGFFNAENLVVLVRSVALLGVLGLGMALVVIGRGIDLSMISVMAISAAWSLQLGGEGVSFATAIAAGLAFALVIGAISGYFIAYVEVPSIFATLAMGAIVYGVGRYWLVPLDVVYLPESVGGVEFVGKGKVAGIPVPILVLLAMVALVHGLLKHTKLGQMIYAIGDNLPGARISGLPVRPIIVAQYMTSSVIAYIAGIVTALAVSSMNTRIVNSTQIYDVILVVILGGIGLNGGRGGVSNVVAGTLLIGILLNGMIILDMPYTVQNVVKSLILLAAIVVDAFLNPRDEQTAQQGDI